MEIDKRKLESKKKGTHETTLSIKKKKIQKKATVKKKVRFKKKRKTTRSWPRNDQSFVEASNWTKLKYFVYT